MDQPIPEPLLVYRQKNRPWNVVMLGRLETLPYECDGGVWRVQVSFDDFLFWFSDHLRAWWSLYPPRLQNTFITEKK
jgi:hypothetical protein